MKIHITLLILLIGKSLFSQTFIEKLGTPFEPNTIGDVVFADIDGDNDEDVLITGSSATAFLAVLYTNDGLGNFTEVTGTPFAGVGYSSAQFADVDGDNDNDLLITGQEISMARSSKLYLNDGQGNFSLKPGTPFDDVHYGVVRFSDVDGDNDQDVLIAGALLPAGTVVDNITKLYTNDGQGNFTEVLGTPFTGISIGDAQFADVDGDNDKDLLLIGLSGLYVQTAELFINDGQGNFTLMPATPFFSSTLCAIAFSDVDGDNDQDVVISGNAGSGYRFAKLYTNDGQGNFTELAGTPFTPVVNGSLAFADIDSDSDEDLLLTGFVSNAVGKIAKIYTNDGMGTFTELTGLPFEGVDGGGAAFSDVDGDSDQDVLITGSNTGQSAFTAKLYLNNLIQTSIFSIENEIKLDFLVFPNPSISNKINISYESHEHGELTMTIYDLNGRLLQQQSEKLVLGEHVFTMQLPSMPKGDYIIEFDNGKHKGSQIFSIQ